MPSEGIDTVDYRVARPGEKELLDSVDGSFTTATIFEVAATDTGFSIREKPVDPPVSKSFPDEEADEEEDVEHSRTFVALDAERACGLVATTYDAWNRRLTIDDIEVSPTHRGRGIGRALMELALGFGRERGAVHAWLEVTSINVPAIRAYRRMGFAFCGLDATLYDGTQSAGETALFMNKPLARPGDRPSADCS